MDYNKHLPFTFFGTEGLVFPVLYNISAHHWEQQFALTPYNWKQQLLDYSLLWFLRPKHRLGTTPFLLPKFLRDHKQGGQSSRQRGTPLSQMLEASDVSFHFTENPPVGTHLSICTFRIIDCLLNKFACLLLLSKSQSIFCWAKYSLPCLLISYRSENSTYGQ